MKLVVPALTVNPSDGFTNDAFKRKSFGESLTRLVTRTRGDLVISLDGQWGEGKSTFVKMWQGHLTEAGVPSIYIDAFENDYTEDAFIFIASAITSYVERNSDDDKKPSAFKDTAKKVGVQLLSWSAKVAIKAATLGALDKSDLDSLSDVRTEIADDASDIASDFIKERLSAHAKQAAVISSFKQELSLLPSKLKGNESGCLVIVIDELDRCKPSFSVEILEKIKHLFSVPNVIFVLVMNKQQLEESIKSVYGSNIDAQTYLQKFISIETTLPKRLTYRGENDLSIYSRKLLELHAFEHWGDGRNIIECLEPLADHFNLSLRQLEKTYTNLAIIYSTSEENHLRLVPLIVFISVLKVVNPEILGRINATRITYDELAQKLGLPTVSNNDPYQRKLFWLMQWVKYGLLTETEFTTLKSGDELLELGKSLWRYNIDRTRLFPLFCSKLNMFSIN